MIVLFFVDSFGGNLLLNVGPTADGRIPIVFQERLQALGKWIKVNGEAIYETKMFHVQNDTITESAYYTQSKDSNRVYCLFTKWPEYDQLRLSIVDHVSSDTKIEMLTTSEPVILRFSIVSHEVRIQLEPKMWLQHAWVLRLTN